MNKSKVKIAFELKRVKIPLVKIIPTKQLHPRVSETSKYQQAEISVRKIGIIEPLLIYRNPDCSGNYFLLDGHMRIQILENMGITEAVCILSTEDEGYIANRMINRLAPVQEHVMVFEAIQSGAPAEKLADNLGLDVKKIGARANLLKGICKEVANRLKVRSVPYKTFSVLKKMTS
jgi:ParB-like chromosome segregation protein Spo0J